MALAKIKQAAIEKYNSILASAKELLLSTVKDKITSIFESLFGGVATKAKSVIDAISTIKKLVQTANKVYTTTVRAAAVVKAQAFGTIEAAKETISQAVDAYVDNKLNSSGVDVDTGAVNKTAVLASVDPEIEPDNSDTGLSLKIKGAKVKLNSIEELTKVIQNINRKLNLEGPADTRAWVHNVIKLHPKVDDNIKDLEYFKPISDETGVTYLRHTPDTQTLALEDWKTNLPNPFRRSLEAKLDRVYDDINKVYFDLNNGMARNISTEFFYERDINDALMDQGANYLNKKLLSNDYHIAGDYTFAEDHLGGTLERALTTALISKVGGAAKLINWLRPVNSFDSAICGSFQISVEGNDVVVDLKGNKVGVIATVIDETLIKVKDTNV